MSIKNISLFIFPIFLITSCAVIRPGIIDKSIASPRTPTGELPVPTPVQFDGLVDALHETSENGGELHLFLVHGMGAHPFGSEKRFRTLYKTSDGTAIANYDQLLANLHHRSFRSLNEASFVATIHKTQFVPLVPRLLSKLELDKIPVESELHWIENEAGHNLQPLGYKLKETYTRHDDIHGHTHTLVVHLCAWSPVTIPGKLAIRNGDTYSARNTFVFNRVLKNSIVSWGLSDAAQYVGKMHDPLNYTVARGIEAMIKDAGITSTNKANSTPHRFAFGAASLGSAITLESLATLSQNNGHPKLSGNPNVRIPRAAFQAMFRGNLPIYLFANQIPLLWPNTNREGEHIKDIAGNIDTPQLTVVAFNDPADLLGYRVPAIRSSGPTEIRVINVTTRNQAIGIWGLFANPLDAHGGFPKTRAVVDLMAAGDIVKKNRYTGSLPFMRKKPNPAPRTAENTPATGQQPTSLAQIPQ